MVVVPLAFGVTVYLRDLGCCRVTAMGGWVGLNQVYRVEPEG
jgi:hypothetical protein